MLRQYQPLLYNSQGHTKMVKQILKVTFKANTGFMEKTKLALFKGHALNGISHSRQIAKFQIPLIFNSQTGF